MRSAARSRAVSPLELWRRVKSCEPGILLDVRTPGEFKDHHILGAMLTPLRSFDAEKFLEAHEDPETPIYLICQSGARARKAMAALEDEGCDRCVLLEGGMDAWNRADLPVRHDESSAMPLLRQAQIAAGAISTAGSALALAYDSRFAAIPLAMGLGLVLAGCTGTSAMATVLSKLPWNRGRHRGANPFCEGSDSL